MISLKQLLPSRVNNEVLGDIPPNNKRLSYSDYHTPNIPYDVKPIHHLERNQVNESPDELYYDSDNSVHWNDDHVVSTFGIFFDEKLGSPSIIGFNKNDHSFITDNEDIKQFIDAKQSADATFSKSLTNIHWSLVKILADAGKVIFPTKIARGIFLISGRLWNIPDVGFAASFWNHRDTLKRYKKYIDKFFDLLKINPKIVKFEVPGQYNELISYDETFGSNINKNDDIKQKQDELLMKIQHLSPEAKKELNKLGYNKKAVLAQKLGIDTVAELNNLLMTGIDESVTKKNTMDNDIFNTENLKKRIDEFYKFVANKFNIIRAPKIILLEDEKNANEPYGLTGHFNPQKWEVILHITKRHPTDILRTLGHELVHVYQHENGSLKHYKGDIKQGYAQNDKVLRKAEAEAYLKGCLIFRDWQDLHRK
jgi:hypothetical protein